MDKFPIPGWLDASKIAELVPCFHGNSMYIDITQVQQFRISRDL